MRSTVITVCIFSCSTLLAPGEAQALDVNQACNGDFNRYCGRYDWVGRWDVNMDPHATPDQLAILFRAGT